MKMLSFYVELLLWLPDDADGGNNVNVSKTIEKGLKFRKLEDTLKDTLGFSEKGRIIL